MAATDEVLWMVSHSVSTKNDQPQLILQQSPSNSCDQIRSISEHRRREGVHFSTEWQRSCCKPIPFWRLRRYSQSMTWPLLYLHYSSPLLAVIPWYSTPSNLKEYCVKISGHSFMSYYLSNIWLVSSFELQRATGQSTVHTILTSCTYTF